MLGFLKKRTLTLYAPMAGEILRLEDVPDPVFAQKMVGDGLAIYPADGEVYAPCAGKIVQLFPTKHAVGIRSNGGIDILIHVGIDTVGLKGEGFKAFVAEGDTVNAGDKLLAVDLEFLKAKARSIITPVLVTNMDKVRDISLSAGKVAGKQDVLMKVQY